VINPPLDAGPLEALRNLHKKQQGGEVGFINIADARTPQGWEITDAGVRSLAGAT
jgi:hypothetical protein